MSHFLFSQITVCRQLAFQGYLKCADSLGSKKNSYCLLIRLWGQIQVWGEEGGGSKFLVCVLAQSSSVALFLDISRLQGGQNRCLTCLGGMNDS